jgi:hypothetical protein
MDPHLHSTAAAVMGNLTKVKVNTIAHHHNRAVVTISQRKELN